MNTLSQMARFNARVARAWNAGVWPTVAHAEAQNHYLTPKPARAPKQKPATRTYKAGAKGTRPWPLSPTTPTQTAQATPAQVEAERQIAIRETRIANLEKARAVKAAMQAKRNRTGSKSTPADHLEAKETVNAMSEIDTLRAQVAALTAAIERMSGVSAPAQVQAPTPAKASAPAKPVKAPYVKTALKMVDYGKGRRALEVDGTLIVVAWNGKTWDYACGGRKGTAADRGEAFAKVNLLCANAGLPPVRA